MIFFFLLTFLDVIDHGPAELQTTSDRKLKSNNRDLTKNKMYYRHLRCIHRHKQRSTTPCFLKVGGNNLSHNTWHNRFKTHFHRTKAPKRCTA